MNKSIVIIGCFDTKGTVFSFLRNCILARGERVITINTGIMPAAVDFPIDYPAETVAAAADCLLTDLQQSRDRGQAVEHMSEGAFTIMGQLVGAGVVQGVVGMGGGGGTLIALRAMQAVPFGIPKICLSTLATRDLSRQVGAKDITLMPSVVDVAGLNSLITPLIGQAAAAICAMSQVGRGPTDSSLGHIAVSMFGNTTACVEQCTALLTKEGYEVVAFHANGIGGKAMEALIRENRFDAVLDITTTELADEHCGGICSAGPDRLRAAAEMGIPQVVVPGCLDMVNFGHPETVPARYAHRQLYSWAPDVTLMRTDAAENDWLGGQLAQKVNQSKSAVTVVVPLKGLSQIDAEGGVFYQPDNNNVLFEAIRLNLSANSKLIESASHINDQSFSALLVASLLALLRNKKSD